MTAGSPESGRRDGGEHCDESSDGRGQLSMPVVEAGIGVVLVLGIAALLALGTPAPQAGDPQLEAYAEDVATVLSEEDPRHGGMTRLDEVSRAPGESEAATARQESELDALEQRVDELLPDNLLFRIETPHATAGFERPDGVTTGTATVTTQHGTVRFEVWYP